MLAPIHRASGLKKKEFNGVPVDFANKEGFILLNLDVDWPP
jgi:hypothetical protein